MTYEQKLHIITKACEDKLGVDLKVLDIRDLTTICDAFVIVSGNSTAQVKAIADEIDDKMSEANYELMNREGMTTARWVLMDYGDIIVHIFHKDEREFYHIERLWEKGEDEDD